MATRKTLTLTLTDGRTCRATDISGGDGGFAILLPGLNYSCRDPLLAGVSGALQQRGYRVWEVAFSYNDGLSFKALSDDARIAAIERDGRAILKRVLEEVGRPLVLVGKSLGTVSLGAMVGALPEKTRLIWLTPSLTGTRLLQRMRACSHEGLSVIGSEDVSTTITRGADYRSIAPLAHVEVPGMDHGWHHEGGEMATRKGLFTALAVIGNWLDALAQLDKTRPV